MWHLKKPMFADYDEANMSDLNKSKHEMEKQLIKLFGIDICTIVLDYIPRRVPAKGNFNHCNHDRYKPYRWKLVDTRIEKGEHSLQNGFNWLITELLNTKTSKYYDPMYDIIRPYCSVSFCQRLSCINGDRCYCCCQACDFCCFFTCNKKRKQCLDLGY